MNEYLDPDDDLRDNKSERKNNSTGSQKVGNNLERKGPKKDKNFKVLNKGGSLPDHPYNNEPGGGALEGTVGIGT
jgi:hypothetical protein